LAFIFEKLATDGVDGLSGTAARIKLTIDDLKLYF